MLQTMFGKQLDDATISVYWNVLNNFSDDEWKRAMEIMIKTFHPTSTVPFPVPADFFKAIGDDDDTIVNMVISDIKRGGKYGSVEVDSATADTINDFGGWPHVSNWTQDDWRFKEAAFIARWKAHRNYDGKGTAVLLGIFDESNMRNGYISGPECVNNRVVGRDALRITESKKAQIVHKKTGGMSKIGDIISSATSDDTPF